MPFNFLALPRELRDMIYTHALVLPSSPIKPASFHQTQHHLLAPALLLANRQIHLETAPIFYGQNSFDLTDLPGTPENEYSADLSTLEFVQRIGRANAQAIKQAIVCFPTFGPVGQVYYGGVGFEVNYYAFRDAMAWLRGVRGLEMVYDQYDLREHGGRTLAEYLELYEGALEAVDHVLKGCGKLETVIFNWACYIAESGQEYPIEIMAELEWTVVRDADEDTLDADESEDGWETDEDGDEWGLFAPSSPW